MEICPGIVPHLDAATLDLANGLGDVEVTVPALGLGIRPGAEDLPIRPTRPSRRGGEGHVEFDLACLNLLDQSSPPRVGAGVERLARFSPVANTAMRRVPVP